MTSDGSQVFFRRDERGVSHVFHASMQADGSLGEPAPVFAGPDAPNIRAFDVSPDGRLLAFTTENADTPQLNLVVTTLPDLRERRQVTSSGVGRPLFSRDGRGLYFLSEQRDTTGSVHGQLNIVSIAAGPLTISARATLFGTGEDGAPLASGFDIDADGRLLMTRRAAPQPGDEARAVLRQNWMAALGR
jgi:Tol biopolymer transport system component